MNLEATKDGLANKLHDKCYNDVTEGNYANHHTTQVPTKALHTPGRQDCKYSRNSCIDEIHPDGECGSTELG